MELLFLVPVFMLTLCTAVPRDPLLRHWRLTRLRAIRALRQRTMRLRLPEDWWEQFERDLSVYLDPRAVRARNQEMAR